MKQIYSYTQTYLTKTLLIALVLLTSFSSFSQTIPELVFKNSDRISGFGGVGTIYKFSKVATGIDALVKISDRSSSKVSLSSIDLTNSGYDNAFQPQVAYDDGDAPRNFEWWMEFTISFVKSSDNTTPITVGSFNVTALDLDGNDDRLRERLTFYGLASYTLEKHTDIDVTNTTDGKTFTGSQEEYVNINTSETEIMVTNKYVNTHSFRVRIGSVNGNSSARDADRMSSLWFKAFTYSEPVNTLPIDLVSFKARKDNKTVILDWVTSMEKDFNHFVIERSTDGSSFSNIATVASDGNNSTYTKSYTFTDRTETQSPIVYYRLQMVDIDGKFKYSEVRTIRNAKDQDQASIVVYPNPAVNELRVTIPANWQNKTVTYSVYNSNGNVVKQKISNQASQTETLNLAGMKTGIYIIKVATADQTTVKQFSKQG